MSYEQLSLSSLIHEMKEVTDGFHPRKFCFVLGAGASKSSGIKSGQELVKIWDKELRERNEPAYLQWRKEKGITDENMFSFYSQYYEKRFGRCRADGYNFIEKIMESATPSAGYVMLAHVLTQTPHNVVITTNFDHLTEDAVNYYAQNTPLVIGHESLSHYVSGQPVRPTVIKIHRDLLFDPKNRSEDLEQLPESWKSALELIFSNYHPIFIGYAGNDKSLMDFLVDNAGKFDRDEWKYPYWMLYKTDKLEGRIEEFLSGSSGYYTYHSGFDDVMIRLGAAFDYAIPSEDKFLEDARKRFKDLKDTIDALSAPSKTASFTEAVPCGLSKTSGDSDVPNEVKQDEADINLAIQKITSQSELQRMYREASGYMEARDYIRAVEVLEKLVKLDGSNPRYHKSLGGSFLFLHKYKDAQLAYQRALELDPRDMDCYYGLALSLENNHEDSKAIAVAREAAKLETNSDGDYFVFGSFLERLKQYGDALALYYKAVGTDPHNVVYISCVARMMLQLNQFEETISWCQKAIALKPDYAAPYETMSLALYALGRNEEANAASKKAMELNSRR